MDFLNGCFWIIVESVIVHCLSKHLLNYRKKNYIDEFSLFKDVYREKALSYKTPGLTKSMNIVIWVIGTSNQLFLRGS